MRRHRLGGDATSRRHQLGRHPSSPQRRAAGSDPAGRKPIIGRPARSTSWAAAKRDLVPELRGELMGIGRAPHPRQHRRVVDGGALGVIDAHPLRQREGDPALAQDVLLRRRSPRSIANDKAAISSARRRRISSARRALVRATAHQPAYLRGVGDQLRGVVAVQPALAQRVVELLTEAAAGRRAVSSVQLSLRDAELGQQAALGARGSPAPARRRPAA